ncbi:hypothetical protein J2728_000177 [Caulobacter segnis]|nr:hypothetical protein [Caulobacter segnis]
MIIGRATSRMKPSRLDYVINDEPSHGWIEDGATT